MCGGHGPSALLLYRSRWEGVTTNKEMVDSVKRRTVILHKIITGQFDQKKKKRKNNFG